MEETSCIKTLLINVVFSIIGFILTMKLIPGLKHMFIKANLYGIDMSKTSREKVPEAQGVICGAIYLIVMFVFIPIPFLDHLATRDTLQFPFHEYVEFLAALLSICCMIFLGFADDVMDLKWRHKLLLPTIASLPLLMVYFVTFDLTEIIVPKPLRGVLGYSLDIGLLYYLYMGMLAVFCTNAINIVAGINGIEAGQGLVIGLSVIAFNIMELGGNFREAHLFSLYFLLPYVGVCSALLYHNWYPSGVFVGDTFCYFSGMTFAVVAILGHFSKTMLLFFIPQVFNFILSTPQLFRFVPCPRHRLPRFDPQSDTLRPSMARFKSSEVSLLGRIILRVFSLFRLIELKENEGEDGKFIECTNMTIINLALRILGPTHEQRLTFILLMLQVFCSVLALFIRYPLARLVYERLQ
ncbi:hypothetical protein CAPTEDRAFT_171012 [Capitella teleta]|uniref:UDP-N-acetylglucosamine--dolichyl-phosphate N-acetylglucosaminephosphotransferase n=1 Tax=Capitella teleta TaxID=283909 RepID=R7U1S9_CAPTE|nr:hypothetical protein CAPTEDRAFT_171012 [Capitella teleta]|eukprot:ELT97140.1 hypothetical protein CAPTEDRAFT_171012 [Capitella teleta]